MRMKIELYDESGCLVRKIEGLKSIYVGEFCFRFIKQDGTVITNGIARDLYDTFLIEEE